MKFSKKPLSTSLYIKAREGGEMFSIEKRMTLLQDHRYLALGFAWVCLCNVWFTSVCLYRAISLKFFPLGANLRRTSLCTHNFFRVHCFCPYHFDHRALRMARLRNIPSLRSSLLTRRPSPPTRTRLPSTRTAACCHPMPTLLMHVLTLSKNLEIFMQSHHLEIFTQPILCRTNLNICQPRYDNSQFENATPPKSTRSRNSDSKVSTLNLSGLTI